MLSEIRERAQGWVAWAIVILISIPFALWGIQSYLGVGGDPVVAKVNGHEITERQFNQNVQRTRMELRNRLGDAYDPDLFGGLRLRDQVLDSMIRDTVLLDASRAMGLATSDAAVRGAILAEPAFQLNGAFDNDTYRRVLQLQGLTPSMYEEQLRQRLLATQLSRAVSGTEFVLPGQVDESIRLLDQQRRFEFVRLGRDAYVPQTAPDDAEIQAFYDANQDLFQVPEQVRVSYLLLDANSLAGSSEAVDEQLLRARYEEQIEQFVQPERRGLRHILLTVPMDADNEAAAAVKARMEALRERILAGEPFADIAAEASEDPGSAAAGGDLGMVDQGVLDPAIEQAAFALEANVLSEPVRSRFGYHLLEVTAVEGGAPLPFEEVRAQLLAELSRGDAEAAYFDLAERLANLTYESPDSLIPAAEALDMSVQTSDWFDRAGGEGLFASPRVVAAAFSEEVLAIGSNSDLIEPDPEAMQAIVLRVDEHRPASVQPLSEVREQVLTLIQERRATDAARAAAMAMVERLEAGEPLAEVAEAQVDAGQGGPAILAPGPVGRNTADVDPAVLDLAFSLPRPAPDSGSPQAASTVTADGDVVVVQLFEVIDGDPAAMAADARAAESRVLASALARSAYDRLLDDLESRAQIEREPLGAEDVAQ
ncbi:peptidylprolyl isomerase [Thiohalocapsa marina]|uniref:Periplasmic chaperone PpiD n=1 Tax=Thiohalocapsa marina TaxID=424902 RepID=A0A5M8FHR2_9GAMM|nr:SurA N-terminal domain-containing protein [Thiohalocapsa marina]KAA6183306.1 peptidylprolyl isomerase [Thiohalocapsa marina]